MVLNSAELGSFAAAARRMNITPSAVSRGVSELERSLNTALFNRTTRVLKLTEDGRRVQEQAVEILDRLAGLRGSVAGSRATIKGLVRVGSSPAVNRHVIMPALADFLGRYPEVELQFELTQNVRSMHADNLDVLIHVGEPPDSRLMATRLAQGHPAVYASPAYLNRYGEPAEPADLTLHRCLVFRPPWQSQAVTEWMFVRDSQRKSVIVKPAVVSGDREGLITAGVAGCGLIFMACFDPGLIISGQLRRLLTDWHCEPSFNIYVMHRRMRGLPAQVVAFVEFCEAAFRAFDPESRTIVHAGRKAASQKRLPLAKCIQVGGATTKRQ